MKLGFLRCINEGRIQPKSANQFILEAATMLNPEVKIATQLHSLVYINCHFLNHSLSWGPNGCITLHLAVKNLIAFQMHTVLICPYQGEVISINYFCVRLALPAARHIRNGIDNYLLWGLKHRRFDYSLVYWLKVFHISHLTRLGDSLTVLKSLLAIVSDCIFGVFCEPTIDQIAAYQRACTALTCITMDYDYILCIFL